MVICAKRQLRLADLREIKASDLEPLLTEEIAEWRQELDWDYSRSADVVCTLADTGTLGGLALLDGAEVAGLGYCGVADGKAQIWDVYVRPEWRRDNNWSVLFHALLDMLAGTRCVRRIESQLMLSPNSPERVNGLRSFERVLMMLDTLGALPQAQASTRFRLEPWDNRHQDAAATVLSLAHAGHVDAQLSDQYRTLAGASRFLHDLVRFPGCASFCRSASHVAFETTTGQPAGIALTNFVAEGVGHIAELCVTPDAQGCGLGQALLRKSVHALGAAGASRVSLTVTACNDHALSFYTRCGFREMRRFPAYVWEDLKPLSCSIR